MHQNHDPLQSSNRRRDKLQAPFGWSALSFFILLALITLLAPPQQVARAGPSFTTDKYLVVVQVSTPTAWRVTTGSITVNANTHQLFLALMRQSH